MYHRIIDNHGLTDQQNFQLCLVLEALSEEWKSVVIRMDVDGGGDVRVSNGGPSSLVESTIIHEWTPGTSVFDIANAVINQEAS